MAKLDDKQKKLFTSSAPQMSEGYYYGDKLNPNLRAFVEQHVKERPYDPKTDNYDVPPFDKPIEATKATAIYNLHTYWSKKPHDAIRQYINHYTKPGDLVLDPFCGSGGAGLAAIMEGRKSIAIDRSPAATFISKNYCTPIDIDSLQGAFEELRENVETELDWLYETKCDRCGGKAKTSYTIYSQVFQCPRCLEKVPLFDCIEVESKTKAGKPKKISTCPFCYQRGNIEEIDARCKKYGAIPVFVSYTCKEGCKPARDERRHNDSNKIKYEYFHKYDLGKIHEIESSRIPYWYPRDRMMHAPENQECWGVKWRSGTSNFKTVDELFTKRNLWALAIIKNAIGNPGEGQISDALLFALQGILLINSKMCRAETTQTQNGTYYLPAVFKELVPLRSMGTKIRVISEASKERDIISTQVIISTQSATKLENIPSNSVDYIFTDPPYAENVQYGELNFIWESWMSFDTHWHDEEIIVNDFRGKSELDWANMMRKAMGECYRVLKPGRWLSLCYHDTSEGTWSLIQDIMAETGYISDKSDSAIFIDTGQKSYNQLVADKVNKRDLVINFRKPKQGELTSDVSILDNEDKTTFDDKVRVIIREYLNANPGETKDRIYDEVISRMVRKGQMEAHDFDSILRQIAEEVKNPIMKNLFEQKEPDLFGSHEISKWYLKETELSVHDDAESAKEDKAAENLETFIKEHLRKNPSEEGVHYSDLFEQYVYSVKDKPRRQLAEWLSDYFYKTEDGTWRPPSSEEEEKIKSEGRAKGTGRRIKRYLALIEQGVAITDKERPSDATLAEWIRHCKRSGLFEQGKLLYEKGGLNLDNLSEEVLVTVEEDYQVCVRMLARIGNAPEVKPKRGRKTS